MWLLKFHVSFSILCFITFIGFRTVFKQQIEENRWGSAAGSKRGIINSLIACFVPIMNVLIVLLIFFMIFTKKEDCDNLDEKTKNDKD